MTSHLLCAMFAKALCANIGRNFPCVRNDVIYSFWKKNYGEYNFPMNCVWENNMKLNSLVAAHIIIIFLAVAAMLRSSSAYAHMSCSVIFHPFSQCYGWCSTYILGPRVQVIGPYLNFQCSLWNIIFPMRKIWQLKKQYVLKILLLSCFYLDKKPETESKASMGRIMC